MKGARNSENECGNGRISSPVSWIPLYYANRRAGSIIIQMRAWFREAYAAINEHIIQHAASSCNTRALVADSSYSTQRI